MGCPVVQSLLQLYSIAQTVTIAEQEARQIIVFYIYRLKFCCMYVYVHMSQNAINCNNSRIQCIIGGEMLVVTKNKLVATILW